MTAGEARPARAGTPATELPAWPESIDRIVDGDHVVACAYATPASGVVIVPLCNFGVRDRRAGTITVNSSVGAPRKLERIRRDPHVALAFHTRSYAAHDRSEYVLVQGRATLSQPIPDYPSSILEHWQRFEPWEDLSPVWRWWQRVHTTRVAIAVAVERMIVWPSLSCHGAPDVLGTPLPDVTPPSQRPPRNGTGPRLDHRRAERRAARLPHTLLGWIGADGFPIVVPVSPAGAEPRGIVLSASRALVPSGDRRAGLTAHGFSRRAVGQHQRKHTGWLHVEPDGSTIVFAPHTDASYRLPPSRVVYRLTTGAVTRLAARRHMRTR